jgi:flagellar basal-body rod modification protein FlgD
MATESKFSINSAVSSLDPSLKTSSAGQAKKTDETGKDEFLQLLVTQLQNQDPLDPMKNEDFAVNLAQFSQLEQLIDINSKTSEGSAGTPASMASYLGHEIVMNTSEVDVNGGNGGKVSFSLEADAANVSLDLLDGSGNVRGTLDFGAMKAGKHSVNITGANVPSGSYEAQVSALSSTGTLLQPETLASGVVSGFVPGSGLLVNGREIDPADIREVHAVA